MSASNETEIIASLCEKYSNFIPALIDDYNVDDLQKILQTEFPIDYPINFNQMSTLAYICSLPDNTS